MVLSASENLPQQVWYGHMKKGLDFCAQVEVKFLIATEEGISGGIFPALSWFVEGLRPQAFPFV
jgi:hypothetical protein